MSVAGRDDERLEQLELLAAAAGLDDVEVALPQERDVIANGIRLHYLEWGTADQPTVIFLHGGSLTAHTWDATCLGLRADHHCIALDMRGHGDSEWPADGDYRLERFAEDVAALATALNLERFVLVGHSMGGATSLEYSGRGDERLQGLVLVDFGPVIHLDAGRRVLELRDATEGLDTFDEYLERLRALSPRRDERLLRRGLQHSLRRLPSGRWTWKWDDRRMRLLPITALKERYALLWERVESTACPTLVVRGGRSEVLPRSDADELVARLPDGRLEEVPGAGHTVQGSHAAELLEVLRPFLREVTRPGVTTKRSMGEMS